LKFDKAHGIDIKSEYAQKAGLSKESNPLSKEKQSTMSGTGMTQDGTRS